MLMNCRTDMAVEAHAISCMIDNSGNEIEGVKLNVERRGFLTVSSVEILDHRGELKLNKPVGKYFTADIEGRFERGSEQFSAAAQCVADLICSCADINADTKVLIAALGNPDITPDALGSLAASNIIVTRHLKESGHDFDLFSSVALCRTGVLGTTGSESALQLKALCEFIRPDLIIAIDALAGADYCRLCRSIQVSNSGIAPGSGVGNSRESLCESTLGVPVIAIGAPTVIDASAFSGDNAFSGMFVTPRDIDSSVRSLAKLIAYGINLAVHKALSVSDIDMLVG